MNFQLFGKEQAPMLLLIPGLGVSYEIFLPLIHLVEDRFRVIAKITFLAFVYKNLHLFCRKSKICYKYTLKKLCFPNLFA